MNNIDKTENLIGIIKWYSKEKGYGVINIVNSEQEIFLHISNWTDNKINELKERDILVFDISLERNKQAAKKCRYFNYSIEDYKILFELTQEYKHYLYVINEMNKKIKIIDLIDENKVLNFSEILKIKLLDVEDNDFISMIERYIELFSRILVTEEFISTESLRRFNISSDMEFQKNLLLHNYVQIKDIDINFILKYIDFDDDLFEEILFFGIEQNIQEVDKYIDLYINKIDEINIIKEYNKLFIALDKSKINYDLKNKIEIYVYEKNNPNLTISAYKNDLIDFDINDLFTKYVKIIDLVIIKKIEKVYDLKNKIITIFENNNNQELLKYLIVNFENFNSNNCQPFLDIGIKRLSFFILETQVLYLKKLFHLKALKKLDFTQNDLSAFNDIKILKMAAANSNNIDFSTYLVIDLIAKFNEKDGFITTHELIKSVLNIIQFNPTKKVKISNFFDVCNGIASQKVYSDNIISKIAFLKQNGELNYYLKVEFPYNEEIVHDIKLFPTKKYNPDEKFWGVPLRYQNEVVEFGKKHGFLFRFDEGNFYENNKHIVQIVKNEKEKPIGIEYCCGQEAQNENNFWWCNQNKCFENNIKLHNDWQEYTLFDFMSILNLNLNELTRKEKFNYKIGLYTRFVVFLNRFNRLLEKLYCSECTHILYSVETGNFHANSVTKFVCKNENCSCKKEIYLNNCLNGQCNAIIDSRESKQCTNGWYICPECGSCCSHIAFERRLNNLSINGGIIYDDLRQKIDTKSGHLEKAEYSCYKCGQFMTEYSESLFKCSDCEVTYDLSKYSQLHKKYIHLCYRANNYPTTKSKMIFELKQILLDEKDRLEQQGKAKNVIFGILFNKIVNINNQNISLKELNNRQLTNEIFN